MHSVKWMTASDFFTFVTVRASHTSIIDGLLIFSENLEMLRRCSLELPSCVHFCYCYKGKNCRWSNSTTSKIAAALCIKLTLFLQKYVLFALECWLNSDNILTCLFLPFHCLIVTSALTNSHLWNNKINIKQNWVQFIGAAFGKISFSLLAFWMRPRWHAHTERQTSHNYWNYLNDFFNLCRLDMICFLK